MTHSQTVTLILDTTRPDGILYHTLTTSVRDSIKRLGRTYMLAHATGQMAALFEAEVNILSLVKR